MTSVGVMASAVVIASGTDVLFEPFNDFTTNSWGVAGSTAIVAARTGNGARLTGASTSLARYTIPTPDQSAYLTLGFAFRISNATGTRSILKLESDNGTILHLFISVLTNGTAEIRMGGVGGALLASTPAATIPINTFIYLELQTFLHDTLGFVTMKANGTQVAAATNVDTKNGGTKTVFDRVCLLGPNSGINNTYDDLYLTMGAGAPFKGDITIP